MRLKQLLIIAFLGISGFSYAQRETRDLTGFDEISLSYPAHLIVTQGDTYKVELEGDRDDLEDIRTEVRGSTLIIKNYKEWGWFHWDSHNSITIYVTMKEVKALSVSGSGRIENRGTINASDLDLDVSGSGKIDLVADAKDVSIDISGSGSVNLEGSGAENRVDISGSGHLDADNFKSESFDIQISGSGRCSVYATKGIYAEISGSGSVYYKGDPDKIRSSVSGSGKVRKL